MSFVPGTDDDRKLMFEKIGVKSFDELIANIPEKVRLKGELDIPPQLSEYEAFKLLEKYAGMNITADSHVCFMGGGAYDHFIPSIVGSVLQKPEFRTAYTPYQAEVSQGTLQAMYEFQTMICNLTGMEVSNASIYDAGSSLAEAALMANTQTKRKTIYIAGRINPNYLETMETITAGQEMKFVEFIGKDGSADLDRLKAEMNDDVAAVIVQHPNYFGSLEDVHELEKIAHDNKSLYIVTTNPISLGVLEAPGNYNADVVVGEGQSLGIPLNFGGPYLGIFACKEKYIRKLPGRIVGITEDENGERCFVLTLQTREQQIKREKATSNICTNQGLFMLASTVYMEALGKQGIKEVAEQSLTRAHYLAEKINEIEGFELANKRPFFNEFLINCPVEVQKIIKSGVEKGFLAGVDVSRFVDTRNGLLIAVTEKRNKQELDEFVEFLKTFA
jgi:glycine dehydrogenase subunit 1